MMIWAGADHDVIHVDPRPCLLPECPRPRGIVAAAPFGRYNVCGRADADALCALCDVRRRHSASADCSCNVGEAWLDRGERLEDACSWQRELDVFRQTPVFFRTSVPHRNTELWPEAVAQVYT